MDDWLFLSHDTLPHQAPAVSTNKQQEEETDRGQIKSKLVSAWNSVKYGWSWKQKSKFSHRTHLIMLGTTYRLKNEAERNRFWDSFTSLLWFTYRRSFPKLPSSTLTTDSGWGCVLRTGQMLLAQGLFLHLMPTGWTWSSSHRAVKDDMELLRTADDAELEWNLNEQIRKSGRKLSLGSLLDRPTESTHRIIVSWFADNPTAPFGIHQLVLLGESSGKKAGDWYGPSIVAQMLRKAVACSAVVSNLVVYVAQDCTIYLQDVRKLCEQPLPLVWKSVIILVPVRLGGEELNPSYIACLKTLLSLECCIGIIGGKPKHSLFFVGFQDNYLLYLDPHYCQPAVDVSKENFSLESFHCKYPRKMLFSRMDPSCTIGFYARTQRDFDLLHKTINEALSTCAETYPMFIFIDGKSQEELSNSSPLKTNITYLQRDKNLRKIDTDDSMDEFVVL